LDKKIEAGICSFEELEQHAFANEPTQKSGQQELYEAIMNRYVYL